MYFPIVSLNKTVSIKKKLLAGSKSSVQCVMAHLIDWIFGHIQFFYSTTHYFEYSIVISFQKIIFPQQLCSISHINSDCQSNQTQVFRSLLKLTEKKCKANQQIYYRLSVCLVYSVSLFANVYLQQILNTSFYFWQLLTH